MRHQIPQASSSSHSTPPGRSRVFTSPASWGSPRVEPTTEDLEVARAHSPPPPLLSVSQAMEFDDSLLDLHLTLYTNRATAKYKKVRRVKVRVYGLGLGLKVVVGG